MNKITTHPLDVDLQIEKVESNCFSVHISNHWSINSTPNGGYLMAVISKTMDLCTQKKATPIITANFISKCCPGEALIHVEIINDSTNFTRLMVRLLQQGEEKIRAFGTFSSDLDSKVVHKYETSFPEMAGLKEAFKVPVLLDNHLFDHIDLRLDPSCIGWVTGDLSEMSEFKGWIGFQSKREIDVPAILLFADTFPPPVFSSFGLSDWVPTIELSVNIRKIPTTHFLKGFFQSRFISNGLVEEDGQLWDTDGELIAISRQISKYRRAIA